MCSEPVPCCSAAAALAVTLADLNVRHPDAGMLLRTVKSASPSAGRLALGTPPASVRSALTGAGLCADWRRDNGSACELTELGNAAVLLLPDLTELERERLRAAVDRRLAEAAGRVGACRVR
jgi:hypothetical protein